MTKKLIHKFATLIFLGVALMIWVGCSGSDNPVTTENTLADDSIPAILSGGFTYFADYLQHKLGFDEVHANELVIENGKVTGEVREPIVDADRKAELLETIALREGLTLDQTIAVGDGANDLKMLAKAGLGIAYRAKPMVRAQARQAISHLDIDAVLYLIGYPDVDLID